MITAFIIFMIFAMLFALGTIVYVVVDHMHEKKQLVEENKEKEDALRETEEGKC